MDYAIALGLPILPVRISEIDPTLIDPAVAPRVIDYAPPKAARGDALMHALRVLARQRRPVSPPFPPPPSVPGKEFLAEHYREQLRDSKDRFWRKQAQKSLDELLPPTERWANSLATSAVLANWARELAIQAPAPPRAARPEPPVGRPPEYRPPQAENRAPAAGTSSGSPVSGIFISYRRDDQKYFARGLHERLLKHFDKNQLFMDVDSIDLGLDFVEVIERRLAQCSVMLVVIGKDWLNCPDLDGGHRRLDDPDDFVRLEIERALARPGVRVIPVLVDGARMPKLSELPEPISSLGRRQSINMSFEEFDSDAARLLDALGGPRRG